MSTFQDINQFDWNSMLSDIQQQRENMNQTQQPQSIPNAMTATTPSKQDFYAVQQTQQPSPISSDDNDIWFDKFLNQDGQMNQDDQRSSMSSNASNTNATTSPLEFSSLFDVNDREDESLFSSNVTSLDNSPLIKAEDSNQQIPKMDLLNQTIPEQPTPESIDESYPIDQQEQTATNANATGSDAKKPKKKRAPRKRLTPHQKQAHNKIEKRYRININAKIAGLQQIIPWVASEKTAFEIGDGIKVESEGEVPRLNKSMILEKATSYILHLQESDSKLKEENEKLKKEIERLGGNANL
ncbi:putative transcription factor [Wickerhamomyces ciferrii]|uniref:Transcription factor n=1 Tax=Wickerhamomyces ciferrii (strain ATCC 14091 / BCRC 22168 / CBS 111 / JCM 3599 / NBRC 0793 / NRRL Y-1031 F-60-10) TaxID=1206466 RepID=K0KJ93_WICCF|nr:putative transcription factor [Wickerhamomyces ciferrii]CCH42202.1 putative transcription factor [Wickerhamomyces ciferrii]